MGTCVRGSLVSWMGNTKNDNKNTVIFPRILLEVPRFAPWCNFSSGCGGGFNGFAFVTLLTGIPGLMLGQRKNFKFSCPPPVWAVGLSGYPEWVFLLFSVRSVEFFFGPQKWWVQTPLPPRVLKTPSSPRGLSGTSGVHLLRQDWHPDGESDGADEVQHSGRPLRCRWLPEL